MRKTNFNMKIETLTVQVDISQPLDNILKKCACKLEQAPVNPSSTEE